MSWSQLWKILRDTLKKKRTNNQDLIPKAQATKEKTNTLNFI